MLRAYLVPIIMDDLLASGYALDMYRSAQQLREDALEIWQAGVNAVAPSRLIAEQVRVDGSTLHIAEETIDLNGIGKIAVVGAGKAAAGMSSALERALGKRVLDQKHVTGWVNVPADCLIETERIHLHAGRPPGVNEPRQAGVEGTGEILRLVQSLEPHDLCICLIAGGGSALLVAPVPPINLEQKIRVTQLLSGAGANIAQLNTVRRALSLVKGGGLARACRAERLISLIISDVLGDPLDTIASGPTVVSSTTAADALAVLEQFHLAELPEVAPVVKFLRTAEANASSHDSGRHGSRAVTNLVIGNNATAVDAAGSKAVSLGYSHAMTSARACEGHAEEVGYQLANMALRMRRQAGPDCLITGGEPVVELRAENIRGKGGRNQQLALAALTKLGDCQGITLLAGGTDGEDGPTDAAGALINEEVARLAGREQLDAASFLHRNDAYNFLQPVGGLLKTGPTHTNVCDLRVVTVSRDAT